MKAQSSWETVLSVYLHSLIVLLFLYQHLVTRQSCHFWYADKYWPLSFPWLQMSCLETDLRNFFEVTGYMSARNIQLYPIIHVHANNNMCYCNMVIIHTFDPKQRTFSMWFESSLHAKTVHVWSNEEESWWEFQFLLAIGHHLYSLAYTLNWF
jgi:hypothetical protein